MRSIRILAAALALALLCGCISVKVGSSPNYPEMKVGGLINGYAQFSMPPSINGTIFEANLLDGREPGEFASIDLWAFGIGLGVVGARLNVPFFETAIGTLFYDPSPLYKPRIEGEHKDHEEIIIEHKTEEK